MIHAVGFAYDFALVSSRARFSVLQHVIWSELSREDKNISALLIGHLVPSPRLVRFTASQVIPLVITPLPSF